MGSMAGTGLAVAWCAPGGITVVTRLALVTMGTHSVIPAVLERKGLMVLVSLLWGSPGYPLAVPS